jgi:hypothetical protein
VVPRLLTTEGGEAALPLERGVLPCRLLVGGAHKDVLEQPVGVPDARVIDAVVDEREEPDVEERIADGLHERVALRWRAAREVVQVDNGDGLFGGCGFELGLAGHGALQWRGGWAGWRDHPGADGAESSETRRRRKGHLSV